tara:strand:+ start:4679 stop:4876 length:198 start_codon:yes stop_codon:yes gene_type:complete
MKNTYEVTYSEVYKWASVRETYYVEASSEEEARQIVDEGGGESMTQAIQHLDNHKSSDFINAKKV